MSKLWTDEEQRLAERAAARMGTQGNLPVRGPALLRVRPLRAQAVTRTFDPTYPRTFRGAQADEPRFYEALGTITIRAIEAILNGQALREPDAHPLAEKKHK